MVIKAGVWFGAARAEDNSYCLVGYTVSPGFEFERFELVDWDNTSIGTAGCERLDRKTDLKGTLRTDRIDNGAADNLIGIQTCLAHHPVYL